MDKDRIYKILDLFLKSWSGALTLPEEKKLNELLADLEWAQLKRDLENDRFIMGRFKEHEKYDSVADFAIFLKRIRRKQKLRRVNRRLRRVGYVAACVLVFVTAGWLLLKEDSKSSLLKCKENMAMVQQIADRNCVRLVLPNNQVVALSKKAEIIPISHLDSIGIFRSSGMPTLDYSRLKNSVLEDSIQYHTLIVPTGKMQSLVLSDGTRVTVNAKSTLKYPVIFADSVREVYLEGEALFEVTKDPGKPFIVSGKDFEVDVLGTVFNVMSYDEEPMSRITLIEGKVRTTAGKVSVLLKPGEQASISPEQIHVEKVNTDAVVAWVDRKITFDAERLDLIMRKICRWYNVQVLYESPVMRERCFTGALLCDHPLEVFLEWMSTTTDMQFILSDGVITIKNFKNQ
ncbi:MULTISPECIES: FecR family protein [Butyricimonas]|uniref:FecR family protein n=1 Tax=Butyricimonas TaxID=574697 RepID=UPI001652572F|nr:MULTISPECIES: FecR family protein [Butyricimonas]